MSTRASSRPHRPVMVAVFLGTALSAFGAERVTAAEPAVADISRYCATCWRNARLPIDSWGDCTQEVYQRLLERVPESRWPLALSSEGDERREFLRAIDTVKKRVQRARRHSDAVEGAADERTLGEQRLAEERETVQRAAEDLLSERQQRILQLSFEGWAVQEIATELAIPVERVSDEKYKAIRKLRGHLATQQS